MADWPHAPVHRFTSNGIFFVTGATYLKRHYYRDRHSLDAFCDMFFGLAREHAISLQAWTMFSNHYHLVANGSGEALHRMLTELHSRQSIICNQRDNATGRKSGISSGIPSSRSNVPGWRDCATRTRTP